MNPIPLIAVVAAVSFAFPQVGDIVFKWIPAAASVIVGVEVPGDTRYVGSEEPVRRLAVALEPVPSTSPAIDRPARTMQLAEVVSAFDAVVFGSDVAYAQTSRSDTSSHASRLWGIFVPFSIFASLLLVVGIAYSLLQLMRIRERERAELGIEERSVGGVVGGDPTRAQLRWKRILEHANTENENDWRHAIIEADIMLDELLGAQGYHGDTVGDKLKAVERSDFNTIDLAWEAHKVRNRIAHEGSAHSLNAREVRRVIALYEQALREFHYI